MNEWKRQMMARFEDREDLGIARLYDLYFRKEDYPESEVLECLSLIESEVGIPVGILRPPDKLDLLFTPVETPNPFKWMVYQARGGDRQAAISSEINRRLRHHDTADEWDTIETLDDLIRAWCGLKPKR